MDKFEKKMNETTDDDDGLVLFINYLVGDNTVYIHSFLQ